VTTSVNKRAPSCKIICVVVYVGELWDAAAGGRSESVFAMGHGVQDSRVEDLDGAKGKRGRWPVDVGGLRVPMADAATGGHSLGESVKKSV
jgi:hypothetical protein